MKKRKNLSAIHLLSLGYLVAILLGTILLLMPFSSKDGVSISFLDALFTATSATCVTGLVTVDTFSSWTTIGQVIIIILIQIGGLGFMTIITLIFMAFKRNIRLYNQTVLMQSAGTITISEVIPLMKKIIIGTLGFEGIGAILLAIFFYKDGYGDRSIYMGIFHSISAFCNAGFDIVGSSGGSLTPFYNNFGILLTLSTLIVIGGLGFIVWSDMWDKKFKFQKFNLHTKIVLVWNGILILVPTIFFFIFEFTNIGRSGTFYDLSLPEKILNSLFLSISPRTAGFNALDLNELTGSGKLLTILLMFIGGNSGSTAGGIKVTTAIIVFANVFAIAKGQEDVTVMKQAIPNKIIKQSSALLLAYLSITILATIIISAAQPFTLEETLFEVVSAIGTVGLTIGVTAKASVLTKIVLIILMYFGRLGAFTLFDLLFKDKTSEMLRKPEGKVLVG
ncbi:MAG: Trk family potassium uptake protein [Erysipelotrichales bacterium]|nr:Trk family potassium uptake protein [Erysipelotrichales bacterium]